MGTVRFFLLLQIILGGPLFNQKEIGKIPTPPLRFPKLNEVSLFCFFPNFREKAILNLVPTSFL